MRFVCNQFINKLSIPMKNNIKHYLHLRYLLYFFALVSGWPCVFFLMGWLPHYTINYILLFIISFVYFLHKRKFKVPKSIATLIFVQIILWFMYSIIHGLDTSYYTRIFLLCITYLLLEIQVETKRLEFLKTYNFWLTFQVVAGALGFILVLLGLLVPLYEFREFDGRPGYFFGLFTTNTYITDLIRNAGFFDEPGTLAFWGVYALLINKLFIENKRVELLLLFGLISTLSMAYFIQIIIYVYSFYKKSIKKLIFPTITFILTLSIIASFNERMHDSVFGRFEIDEQTGRLKGDNRSDLMETCFELFKTSPVFGLGARNLILKSEEMGKFVGANAYFTLACDGLVGQVITWLPFFFMFLLGTKDKKIQSAFWIIIVGLLQRPYDSTQLLYPLLSYSIILHSYLKLKAPIKS